MSNADGAWRTEGAVSLFIEAPAEAIYFQVADVTSTGQRSEECRQCEWLPGGLQGPVVGARFRGHNRSGLARWSRVCEVVAAEPGRKFAFRTLPESMDPSRMDSTIWSYELVPEGSGTRVTQAYRIIRMPLPPFKLLYGLILPQHKDMRPQMQSTLQALKRSVEGPRFA
jgi:hypothetical protein